MSAAKAWRARWQWLAADAVLTACAVVAIVVSAAGSARTGHAQGSATSSHAPLRFNPLVPYASFGWLPAGAKVRSFDLTRSLVSIETGPGRTQISLALDAPGRCRIAGQVRYRFETGHRRAPRSLACVENQVEQVAPGHASLNLTIGPARLSTDFVARPIPGPQVDLSEAVPLSLCSYLSNRNRTIKLGHGVSGTFISFPAGTSHLNESLCIGHLRAVGIGLGVELTSGDSPATAAGYPSVAAVYHDLRFPPGGTTSPVG